MNKPMQSFHPTVFGKHVQIQENSNKAFRHTSFDHGITLTNKEININERVHIKIVDVDETRQWCGSLAIGFTQIDPNTINRDDLPKSTLPNFSHNNRRSYVKRLYETLTKQLCIIFYYNTEGAYYIIDGQEKEITKGIDITKPLWGVIDIYGNVRGLCFDVPPEKSLDGKSLFLKYTEKPDKLPILHYKYLNNRKTLPITFSNIHGSEIDLYCGYKVAIRKRVQKLVRPYLFVNFPLAPGDELYFRILSVDYNYRTSGIIGFTNATPSIFINAFDTLPAHDPAALVDRKEFWLIREDPFDNLSELDEYRISFDKTSGEILLSRNNDENSHSKILVHADPSLTFYPFIFFNGRITAISVFAVVAENVRNLTDDVMNPIDDEKTGDSSDEDEILDKCAICLDSTARVVLLPCGHLVFCVDCQAKFEAQNAQKSCPTCRTEYQRTITVRED